MQAAAHLAVAPEAIEQAVDQLTRGGFLDRGQTPVHPDVIMAKLKGRANQANPTKEAHPMQPSPEPDNEDDGDDEEDIRAELLEVVDHLSAPDKLAALVDTVAVILAGSGIQPEDEAFTSFMDMINNLLPARVRTTRTELIEGGLELPKKDH